MDIAFKTDIGQQRKTNQDYVQFYRNRSGIVFAVVADGMGGHRGGGVASDRLFKKIIRKIFKRFRIGPMRSSLWKINA
ncbi:MAG: hypothetical protein M3026_00375 [Bombilactobacillus sp.]|nr:hypothetical protein [Bombilactobacillus sp.]